MSSPAPIHRVTGSPFTVACFGCSRSMQTDREPVYADPAGPAFKAYYCEPCLGALPGYDAETGKDYGYQAWREGE